VTTGAEASGDAPACRGCGAARFDQRLDLGPQPLCNRFLTTPDAAEYRHPLLLARCGRCGLVQLLAPPPAGELRPRFDWITYREPEGHLDRMVEALCGLPGLGPGAVVGAVSYKDDSTLQRFHRRGLSATWRLDPRMDLGLDADHAEIETVQDRVTPASMRLVATRRPPADLLLARHILEHVHDTAAFLDGLSLLVKPGGLLLFESPDCGRAMRHGDCTTVWEEHVTLFTPATFAGFLSSRGLCRAWGAQYPYPFEDSLVAAVRLPAAGAPPVPDAAPPVEDAALFTAFCEGLPVVRERVRSRLTELRSRGGRIALLGAGHAACTYLNLLHLGDLVAFVVDDDPRKAGLFMPGSRLPIRPSAALLEERIDLCLLAVSAEAEERVIEARREYREAGGRFASISPLSRNALQL